LNAFDAVRPELEAEKINPAGVIEALDYFAWELKNVRGTFERCIKEEGDDNNNIQLERRDW
jgi:hypothetical protein